MHRVFLGLVAFLFMMVSGCIQPQTGVHFADTGDYNDSPPIVDDSSCTLDDLDLDVQAVDACGRYFGVANEQLPGLAAPNQDLVWFGYGCEEGGWQGDGCFPALPILDRDENQLGVGQQLPEKGVFRLACGESGMVDDGALNPDNPAWCDHDAGANLPVEEQWLFRFQECGVQKVNLCIQMIDGKAHPAGSNCAGTYVPPDDCP